ncbi:MAG: DUF4271 domain-containing protein [Bacteroidetes bacterium]|nr:DUF4271 domain-containing protein [Bacteroidota bacterium]
MVQIVFLTNAQGQTVDTTDSVLTTMSEPSFRSLNESLGNSVPLKMIEKPQTMVNGWFFIVNIVLILVLLMKYFFYGEYIRSSWNALVNQNLFFQFIRGRQVINVFLFVVEFLFKIYLFTLITILSVYLISGQWLLQFKSFAILYVGLFLFFSLKSLVSFMLSLLTEHWKEFKAISLINIVFVSNLTWLAVPLLGIVVYLNPQFRLLAVYAVLGLAIVGFSAYVWRAISVLRKIRMNLNMHFFIYLCAFEIVPYLILYKVLYNFKYIF